jgi:hypothetical protein
LRISTQTIGSIGYYFNGRPVVSMPADVFEKPVTVEVDFLAPKPGSPGKKASSETPWPRGTRSAGGVLPPGYLFRFDRQTECGLQMEFGLELFR